MAETGEQDHLVHEAVGPSLHPLEASAALAVGVNSLLIAGVLPVLLGALADEHRLSAAGIGRLAVIEILSFGIATGLAGIVLKPQRLKLIAGLAAVALAAINFASAGAAGLPLMALRAGAGVVEGVLLWITVGMIARTVTPERWAGAFFTAQVLAQLLLALAFAWWILPHGGAAAGYAALAVISLVGIVPAALTPDRYAPLATAEGESGPPPLRGWFALAATFIYVSAGGAVGVYLQPLAHEAGHGAGVARTALWVSLAAQVAGGALAITLAGRVRYFTIFILTSLTYLAAWWVFSLTTPAWMFIAVNAAAGFMALMLGPFLVPFTIDADPSRRAALQSGAAQLLGGAIGPYLASFLVTNTDVRAVLWLGAGLMLTGLAGVAALRFTTRRS